jgi:hypothetical protein
MVQLAKHSPPSVEVHVDGFTVRDAHGAVLSIHGPSLAALSPASRLLLAQATLDETDADDVSIDQGFIDAFPVQS